MISLTALCGALAQQIRERTGVPAFCGRLHGAVYPAYLITAKSGGGELFAGGRQLLRRLDVCIRCTAGRGRDEDGERALLDALFPAVLPHFSAGGRVFCPQGLTADEEDGQPLLRFTLEFCDVAGDSAAAPPPAMDTLQFRLGDEP